MEAVAATRTTREAWVGAGLRALGEGGPTGVRVEPLAAALGVSKGGFYWQFKDRHELLGTVLERWESVSVDEVIARVEEEGDARAKLRRLFALAAGGAELLRADLAVRDWARHDEVVARRLRRVDNRRMDYMRGLFAALCDDEEEVEVRCLIAMSLFVADHFIAAEHGSRSRAEVRALVSARLLA
jgi:AcrR family transcriptional regulator